MAAEPGHGARGIWSQAGAAKAHHNVLGAPSLAVSFYANDI